MFKGFEKADVPWPEASAAVTLVLFCAALAVVLEQIRALEARASSEEAAAALTATEPATG